MSTTTARTSAAPKLDKETNRAFDPLAHKLDYSKISTTGRGYLEYVDHISGQLRICGWMLNAEQPWDSFVLKVNGAPIAEVSPRTRNDVRDFLKTPAFSEMTGFWFDVPTAASQFTNFARLEAAPQRLLKSEVVSCPSADRLRVQQTNRKTTRNDRYE